MGLSQNGYGRERERERERVGVRRLAFVKRLSRTSPLKLLNLRGGEGTAD